MQGNLIVFSRCQEKACSAKCYSKRRRAYKRAVRQCRGFYKTAGDANEMQLFAGDNLC